MLRERWFLGEQEQDIERHQEVPASTTSLPEKSFQDEEKVGNMPKLFHYTPVIDGRGGELGRGNFWETCP